MKNFPAVAANNPIGAKDFSPLYFFMENRPYLNNTICP